MNILKKIVSLCLTALLSACMLLPAAASSVMEHEGLEVSVEMDKEQYDTDEPITATITVKNTTFNTVTIATLEQLIPEGYRLSEDSKASVQNVELPAMRTMTLEVTFEQIPAEQETATAEDFFTKLLYGETWGIPNLLLAVILVIAIVIFMLLT